MVQILREWYNRHLTNPQVVILAVILLIGFLVILFFGRLLAPFLASIVIAYLLEGAVQFLERRGLPRLAAVWIIFTIFLSLFIVVILGLIPLLTRQVLQLFQELPRMIAQGQQLLLQLPERYPQFVSEDLVRDMFLAIRNQVAQYGQQAVAISIASMVHIVSFLVYAIIVPLTVFFLLKDKHAILGWAASFLPRDRSLANEVWHEVNMKIGSYVRGKFLEILLVWAVTFWTFNLLEVNYAALLSFLVGLSVIVPYVGAAVVTIPIAIVAYFQFDLGPEFAYVLIAYGVIQFIDGNLLAPLLFSEVVNIHPVAIVVAVLVFGGLWGMWGVFFAIPLATLVQAIIRSWPRQNPPPTEGEAGGKP